MACRAQGVYFTLDAIYAIQEYGEGVHRLTDVWLWAIVDHTMGTVCLQHKTPKQTTDSACEIHGCQ